MTTRLRLMSIAAVLVLAGCGSDTDPVSAPTTAAPATTRVTATAAASGTDAAAERACKLVAAAIAGTATTAAMRDAAKSAQGSAVEPIARSGMFLERAVELAEAAKGANDEAAMQAGMVTAGMNLSTACANAGLIF